LRLCSSHHVAGDRRLPEADMGGTARNRGSVEDPLQRNYGDLQGSAKSDVEWLIVNQTVKRSNNNNNNL
jgi:hypothetical protein